MSTYPIELNNSDLLPFEEQIEQSPEWLLISESENTKAFYSIERGMYLVAFLSTGDYCMFDEYETGPAIEDKSRCDKCVYEMTCYRNKDKDGRCPDYKRDAPDGGYYV